MDNSIKFCHICETEKYISDFYKNQTRCKSCTKQYASENKERIRKYKHEYRENNLDRIKESNKTYYENNLDKYKLLHSKYYRENKDKIDISKQKFKEENREYLKQKDSVYRKKYYEKIKSDPLYKVKSSLRGMMRRVFDYGYKRESKTEEVIGITFEEFRIYIESMLEIWMTWQNYGLYNGKPGYGWDIDHIIPLIRASSKEEMLSLNHYTNLRPLCSYINRNVKGGRLLK